MSFGGIKRTKHDKVFSDLVRMRVNYTCEFCGKAYPESNTRMGLHCSHYYGRRHRGTRWHPDNGFCLCAGCHQALGENPEAHTKFVESELGEARLQIIREFAHSAVKLKPEDLDGLYNHMMQEFKKMSARRAAGETGRIEFEGYL